MIHLNCSNEGRYIAERAQSRAFGAATVRRAAVFESTRLNATPARPAFTPEPATSSRDCFTPSSDVVVLKGLHDSAAHVPQIETAAFYDQ